MRRCQDAKMRDCLFYHPALPVYNCRESLVSAFRKKTPLSVRRTWRGGGAKGDTESVHRNVTFFLLTASLISAFVTATIIKIPWIDQLKRKIKRSPLSCMNIWGQCPAVPSLRNLKRSQSWDHISHTCLPSEIGFLIWFSAWRPKSSFLSNSFSLE